MEWPSTTGSRPSTSTWTSTSQPGPLLRYSHTTVMARTSKRFVDETLWPEFQEISETLQRYLADVTDRVISQVIHQDSSEADVMEDPKQLPLAVDDASVGPTT